MFSATSSDQSAKPKWKTCERARVQSDCWRSPYRIAGECTCKTGGQTEGQTEADKRGSSEKQPDWSTLCPSFSESCRVSYSEHPVGVQLWSFPKGHAAEQAKDPCGFQGLLKSVNVILAVVVKAAKKSVTHSFLSFLPGGLCCAERVANGWPQCPYICLHHSAARLPALC